VAMRTDGRFPSTSSGQALHFASLRSGSRCGAARLLCFSRGTMRVGLRRVSRHREKTAPCGVAEPVQPCGHVRLSKLKPGWPSWSRKDSSTVSLPFA